MKTKRIGRYGEAQTPEFRLSFRNQRDFAAGNDKPTTGAFFLPYDGVSRDDFITLGKKGYSVDLDLFAYYNGTAPAAQDGDSTTWGINVEARYTIESNFGEYFIKEFAYRGNTYEGNAAGQEIIYGRGGVVTEGKCGVGNGLWISHKRLPVFLDANDNPSGLDVYMYALKFNRINNGDTSCANIYGFDAKMSVKYYR